MPSAKDARPLPAAPIIRAVVALALLLFLVLRGSKIGMPVAAEVVLALGLLMIAAEQVRRILMARRPPAEERVSKHPLGLE